MKTRSNSTLLLMSVFGILLIPTVAIANPTVDPRQQAHWAIAAALVVVAMAIEVVVTAIILIKVCEIEHRIALVGALILMNIATYALFICFLLPMIGSVTFVELLIWITEAYIMVQIARLLSDIPLLFRHALAISFLGNAISFLVGLAV